jgi:hypothetical protein
MVRRASSESDSLLLSSSSNTNGSVSSSPAKSKSGNMAERRCASSGAPDTMMSASRNKLEETRRRGPIPARAGFGEDGGFAGGRSIPGARPPGRASTLPVHPPVGAMGTRRRSPGGGDTAPSQRRAAVVPAAPFAAPGPPASPAPTRRSPRADIQGSSTRVRPHLGRRSIGGWPGGRAPSVRLRDAR